MVTFWKSVIHEYLQPDDAIIVDIIVDGHFWKSVIHEYLRPDDARIVDIINNDHDSEKYDK